MNSAALARIRQLLDAASKFEPDARIAFLRAQCAADRELRGHIDEVIALAAVPNNDVQAPNTAGRAGVPPVDLDVTREAAAQTVGPTQISSRGRHDLDVRAHASDEDVAEDPLIGRQVGQYRVRRLLGAGGMGAVYLAEQENPRRTVALKLIRSGVAAPSILRRFEYEAQILGRLQHPGIAQIFEAGVTSIGARRERQPFFAMEYIEGLPLTEYAERQEFGTRERLALLVRVCEAVQHAHGKGVIHRDLKPANILVVDEAAAGAAPRSSARSAQRFSWRGGTSADVHARPDSRATTFGRGVGQPKILDFGVARATDADIQATTCHTDVGQLVGTVPYMSPEQVRGNPLEIDARTDVYSLGVIAYELLSGRMPHDLRNKSIAEAARVIIENDPAPLSSINRVFRGDVATIVCKAMEKDKSRRYQSAAELAADIESYLSDRPIVARPATTLYQIGKFTKRHRALVYGLAGVILALVLGLIGTSIAMTRARAAEHQARHDAETARIEARKTERINAFLQSMLRSADPEIAAGRDISVRELLDEAARRVGTDVSDEPQIEAAVRETLGRTYLSLGAFAEADRQFQAALDRLRGTSGEASPVYARTLNHLAVLKQARGDYASAEQLYRQAALALRHKLGRDHADVAEVMNNLALMLMQRGDYPGARGMFEQSVSIHRALSPQDHERLAIAIANYALLRRALDEYDTAAQMLSEALALAGRRFGDDHPRLAVLKIRLAMCLKELGRLDEAEALCRDALELRRRVFGDNHPAVALALNGLGTLLIERCDYGAAEPPVSQALAIQRAALSDHPDIADTLDNLAAVLVARGDAAGAVETCRESLRIRRERLGPEHLSVSMSLNGLAAALRLQGQWADAESALREALEILSRTTPAPTSRTGIVSTSLGEVLLGQKRNDEAESALRKAVEVLRKTLPAGHYRIAETEAVLGSCLAARGSFEDAEALLLTALQSARLWDSKAQERMDGINARLARLYDVWRRPE